MEELIALLKLWVAQNPFLFKTFPYFIIAVGLFQNFIYLIQLPIAGSELFRIKLRPEDIQSRWLLSSKITLPISVLIPAYNEEVSIVDSILTTLTLQYPNFEVIVINDGSSDETLLAIKEAFELTPSNRAFEEQLSHQKIRAVYRSPIYSNLVVIDKENGGKADALNAGLNLSRNPLFCTLDADSLLEPTALLKTTQAFIDEPEKMVAVGGTVRISNGCSFKHGIVNQVRLPKKALPLLQVMEYIRAFLLGRMAWSRVKLQMVIAGAFAVFKRDVVMDVGGFTKNTIGEDYELVLKIHERMLSRKEDYLMRFVPEPVCWTEVPESFKVLRSQRIRWQQGALEGFFKHYQMLFNPRFGRIGLVGFPLLLIIDVLGPSCEFLGYFYFVILFALGFIHLNLFFLFFLVFFAFGVFISVCSLVLEEASLKRFSSPKDLVALFLVAIIENFGYRQLNNFWRVQGCYRFLRRKSSWGNMTRSGHRKGGLSSS